MIFYLAEYSLFALSIISAFAPSLIRAVTYCKMYVSDLIHMNVIYQFQHLKDMFEEIYF